MVTHDPIQATGVRGPADHVIRDQIVTAASEHFSRYGYEKTAVADLAKTVGFSKAYIYKFFDSKRAIGEAICAQGLGSIYSDVSKAVGQAESASERIGALFRTLALTGASLFFSDRKIYEIAEKSASEQWQSYQAHEQKVKALLVQIIEDGRDLGEFERATALGDTSHAVFLVLRPFVNPLMLQHMLDNLPDEPNRIATLVLRSLRP